MNNKSHKISSLSAEQWENICQRCGLCCFEKTIDNHGKVTITPTPCRFLDLHSRKCKVYHKRFQVGEDCQQLTPEVVATVDWLPEECAYKKWHQSNLQSE
ncbi:MAG: hypothetical protein B6I36_03790 [Desulfobacteraceae bacterium 4572_35.1]|nr:MAG: hypothetical protein B6I36_03790 [Desulfobacteraceae bacterium 4572_35.1]